MASRLLNTMGISVQKLYIDLLAAMGEDAPSIKDEMQRGKFRKNGEVPHRPLTATAAI